MKKSNSLRAVAALATAFSAVAAQAIPEADARATAQADTSAILLQQVYVVANRATAKTPVAFTNVPKSVLTANNNGQDITYLLSGTPSVTVTSDAGMGTGYTGIRVRGTDPSRINVMANGIPINDSESHQVFWVNMPDLASSLRDVQIQRGAGTSTNGAGAFGASLNMLTDAPSDEAYAELSGAYGMYNTNRQTVRVGSGLLGGHWTVDARLSHIGSDGYIDRASSKMWSYFGQAAYQSHSTSLRLLAFGGKERTYMAWDYASKEDMEKYGRRFNPCGEYTDADGKTAYYPDQYDNFIQHHFQLLLSQRLGKYLSLNAGLHYTKDDGYYDQYKTRRTLTEYGLTPWTDAEGNLVKKSDLIRLKFNVNNFGGGLLTLNYVRSRWNLTFGTSASWFNGHHFGQIKWVRNYVGAIDPLQRYYDNHGRKFDYNAYVRANWDLSRLFSAFADVQYRHIRYSLSGKTDNWDWSTDAPYVLDILRDWNFVNPKLGINFTKGSHRAFVSWSVAQKEPVRDNFTDGDHSHEPKAERLDDFEAGYSFGHGIVTAGVNLYYMLYKDQLVQTGQLSDTGNPLSVNVPHSYRMGVELQAALRPCNWFEWQFNTTLSRNRIRDFVEYVYDDDGLNPITVSHGDTPIAFSPSVILNNAFNFSWRGFTASLQSRYISRQYMDNTHSRDTSLDPYFVSDLHLGYSLKGFLGVKETRVGFSIYNLFSEKYCNNGYAGAGYYTDGGKEVIYRYAGYAAQAPAHVMASLTLRF